jgi:hypothetical protein
MRRITVGDGKYTVVRNENGAATEILRRDEAWIIGGTVPIASNVFAALLYRIEELEDAAAWQPMETAPKDGTVIDFWYRFRTGEVGRLPQVVWTGSSWHCNYHVPSHNIDGEPLLWRHLPKDPA